MAIKVKNKTNLSKQFKDISEALIDDAQKSLRQGNKAEGVHNARKRFKQLRGMLRLIRFGLGEKIYDRENAALRDAGRPLSVVRDADVMIETLDELLKHFKGQVRKGSFKKLREQLVKRRAKIRKKVIEKDKAAAKVLKSTMKIRNGIKRWPKFQDQFGILKKGIRKIYARGQDEMDMSFKDRTVENLHAWRKSVKYLRYQLEFLEDLNEDVIGEMADEAHTLADKLGLDHDLAVLEEVIQGEMKSVSTPKQAELLTALIKQRRSELQSEAEDMGPHLFTDTAKQFCNRLKGYWKDWQSKSAKAAA
jgi:CHAD domain-containing protein